MKLVSLSVLLFQQDFLVNWGDGSICDIFARGLTDVWHQSNYSPSSSSNPQKTFFGNSSCYCRSPFGLQQKSGTNRKGKGLFTEYAAFSDLEKSGGKHTSTKVLNSSSNRNKTLSTLTRISLEVIYWASLRKIPPN